VEFGPQLFTKNQITAADVLAFKGMTNELRFEHVEWACCSAFIYPEWVFATCFTDGLLIDSANDTFQEERKRGKHTLKFTSRPWKRELI
jgi:hypothetical protein